MVEPGLSIFYFRQRIILDIFILDNVFLDNLCLLQGSLGA